MFLFIYDLFTIFLVVYGVKSYQKQMTPLAVCSMVNLFLININNLLLSKIYSFYRVNDEVLFVLFLFNVVTFLVDLFFAKIYRSSKKMDYSYSIKFKSFQICALLFFVGVLAYSINFYRMFSLYGTGVKGKNNGILGHLSSFAFILGPVVLDLALKTRNKYRIFYSVFLYIVSLIISFLFGGKYVIFINITYFVLYFLLKRESKFKLKKLVKIVLLLSGFSLIVFIFIYYVVPRFIGQYDSSLEFAIEHMFYYLLSPIIANNYCVMHMNEGNALFPFAVLINIIRAIVGNSNYVNPINPFIFYYSNRGTTNVAGMIGELIYDIGLWEGLVYFTSFIIFVNILYYKYRTKNKFYLSMCYSTAILVFSFFGNFMSVSGVVFPLILAFVLDILSNCRFGRLHI